MRGMNVQESKSLDTSQTLLLKVFEHATTGDGAPLSAIIICTLFLNAC